MDYNEILKLAKQKASETGNHAQWELHDIMDALSRADGDAIIESMADDNKRFMSAHTAISQGVNLRTGQPLTAEMVERKRKTAMMSLTAFLSNDLA